MKYINVVGGKSKEREIVTSTVEWCLHKLMPRIRNIEIDVTIKNSDAYGYCLMGDTNREFEMEICKGMSLYELIGTVVHEMIHVKQYARGELKEIVGGVHRWKGTLVHEDVNYHDAPWEVEAYELEEELTLEAFKALEVTL